MEHTSEQVIKRIKGLTPRTLIDLSEKGIIQPMTDTTGTGSHRKYNDENLFQIAVAFNLRKIMPRSALKMFMQQHFHETQKDFLLINYWNTGENWAYSATGLSLSEMKKIDLILTNTKKTLVIGPLSIILDLSQIRNELKL
jgi:DNA-binding transcriptional MerR regulator